MNTLFLGAWEQRACDAGYVRACFGVWVQFSADNTERLAEWLLARAEKFSARRNTTTAPTIPTRGRYASRWRAKPSLMRCCSTS
jgi:hypothetical protein